MKATQQTDQINGVINGVPYHLSLATGVRYKPRKGEKVAELKNLIEDWHKCGACNEMCPPNEKVCIVCFAKGLSKKKSRNEIFETADRVKHLRTLMGFRQVQMADMLSVEQGNYSKMERGFLPFAGREAVVEALFDKWKANEIEKLHAQIEYLQSL